MYLQDILLGCTKINVLSYIISFIISILIIVCNYFIVWLRDSWFLNDFLAIMISGAFIKFVIIYKLKGSMIGLVLLWIFCLIREGVSYILDNFNQGFGVRLYPLFLQIPSFNPGSSTLTCSAFGSSKVEILIL
jgi:hypothetical protein